MLIFDALMLLSEAYIVFASFSESEPSLKKSMRANGVAAVLLILSGIPIWVARIKERPLEPFKTSLPSRLMLSLALLIDLLFAYFEFQGKVALQYFPSGSLLCRLVLEW